MLEFDRRRIRMEKAKDTKIMGTMADYLVRKLRDERNGLENAIAYLRSAFFSSAVDALFYARRKAGLTQEQVAQKLGKKQEAIARWEADTEGKMSLRQYFDLAVACGRIPLNMVLEPVESVRDFVIDHPEETQTPDLYYAWLKHRSEPTTASQPVTTLTLINQGVVVTNPPTNVSIPIQESSPTVKSVERYLKEQGDQNTNQASYYSLPTWYGGSATNRTSTTSHQIPVPAQSLA